MAGRRSAWLLGLLFLVVVGPWAKELTTQPASRLALTGALVDHGTIRIDAYRAIVSVDRVERDGHLYSDKGPGQPFLAAPVYALARAVGAEPASTVRGEGNLTLWWVTLWSCAIPGALLVVLMARLCGAAGPRVATGAAAAVGFGSLLLPFSAELYGHALATLCGLASLVTIRYRASRGWMVAAGALAALSVLVEYQMVLYVLVVAGYALHRHGARAVAWFVAGGVPGAALLLAYQAAAFGSPLRSSYGEKPVHAEGGTAIVGIPDPLQAIEVLVGRRGLFVFAPVVLLGLVGLVGLARGTRSLDAQRGLAVVGLVLFGAYLALQAGWPNPWGGEMPGPRYMIPALPLTALGLAVVQSRAGLVGRAAVAWSLFAMALPLITLHLVADGGTTVVQHVSNLDEFGVSSTAWAVAFGPGGWLLHVLSVAVVGTLLARELTGVDEVG